MKIASLFFFLLVFVGDSPPKRSFEIYVEKDGTFAPIPLNRTQPIDQQINEFLSETLPEQVVIYAHEEATLLSVLKIVHSIESASPNTKIRVVTSAAYASQRTLREFVVTPRK